MYRKNAWEKYDEAQLNEVMSFNEGYKEYLSARWVYGSRF